MFDLRSKQEVDRGWAGITTEAGKDTEEVVNGWEATLKNAGIQRSWVPVFKTEDYAPEVLAVRYMVCLFSTLSRTSSGR